MWKIILSCLISSSCLLASNVFAADDAWRGEVYGVVSKNPNITDDFCKQHALDSYDTTATMVDKEVTAKNGVKAKNTRHNIKEVGGLYQLSGTTDFSGEFEGKPWTEKVNYFGYMVKKDGLEQGAWYTKDCKGFYRVGPASEMS